MQFIQMDMRYGRRTTTQHPFTLVRSCLNLVPVTLIKDLTTRSGFFYYPMKNVWGAEEGSNAGVEKIHNKLSLGRLMNSIPSRCQPVIKAHSDQVR